MNPVSAEVLEVIECIPSLKELKVKSFRTDAVKCSVEAVKSKLAKNEDIFNKFSTSLVKAIFAVFEENPSKDLPSQKERIWIQFAKVREHNLPGIWKSFLRAIDCMQFSA